MASLQYLGKFPNVTPPLRIDNITKLYLNRTRRFKNFAACKTFQFYRSSNLTGSQVERVSSLMELLQVTDIKLDVLGNRTEDAVTDMVPEIVMINQHAACLNAIL